MSANIINNALNGFMDPEHIDVDNKVLRQYRLYRPKYERNMSEI
jgi:hypothetical protein